MSEGASFPADFRWGAATASYQIEGAVREGGRGESIWDRFSHTPGKTLNGDTGDVACDHYHRWRDDIGVMQELGLRAYRFSIAWPRIMPNGKLPVNDEGLAFYESLVDGLLEAGIEPWATLYHWDLPQGLQDEGGWPNRDTANRFAEYADIVTSRLGDRVKNWITINEPWVVAQIGHGWGMHAPGHTSMPEVLGTAHHLLLAHGHAVEVIRGNVPDANVGITLNLAPFYPDTDSSQDAEAASRADGALNRWYLDPLMRKAYPEDVAEHFNEIMPEIAPGDFDVIGRETDFLGINYYMPMYVRWDDSSPTNVEMVERDGEHTAMGWLVDAEAFEDLLTRVHADYSPPAIFITENGAAYDDPAPDRGRVSDPQRRRYFHDHLITIQRVREAGIPVNGYFAWSLLDNFEWGEGYSKRFGITHVDYSTQERTIKDSGRWYSEVIQANRVLPLPE